MKPDVTNSRLSWGLRLTLLCLLLSVPFGDAAECTGMGRQYCTDAHEAEACPKPCKLQECRGRRSTKLKRDGARRRGGKPTWEEIAFSGLYEHVYTEGDEICLASCWFEPWDSTCLKWETMLGNRYCQAMDCEHDSRNRYSGCHRDPKTGGKKLPWHKPTCAECVRVFPRACAKELASYVGSDLSEALKKELRKERRELEVNARKYCYLSYFAPVLGIDSFPTTSKQDNPSSSRSLKFSSAEVPSEEIGMAEAAGHGELEDPVLRRLRNMERNGDLTCPPPQCLTTNDAMLQLLSQPWYHATPEGFCMWGGCVGSPMPDPWCTTDARRCTKCSATWCPPNEAPFWAPVTVDNYIPLPQDHTYSSAPPNRSICSNLTVTSIGSSDAMGLPWPEPSLALLTSWAASSDVELWGLDGDGLGNLDPETAEQLKQRAIEAEEFIYETEAQIRFEEEKRRVKAELDRIQEARDLEEKARIYCYQAYSEEAKDMASAAEEDDSDTDDSSDQDDSSSRRLLSSESGRQRVRKLSRRDMQIMQDLEDEGAILCPPNLCYSGESIIPPVQPRSKFASSSVNSRLPGSSRPGMWKQPGDTVLPSAPSPQQGARPSQKQTWTKPAVKSPSPQPEAATASPVTATQPVPQKPPAKPASKTATTLEAKPQAPEKKPTGLFLTGPWYHRTDHGFCTFTDNCAGGEVKSNGWCKNDVDSCIRCDGMWCPPFAFLGWDEVTVATFKALDPELLSERRSKWQPPSKGNAIEDSMKAISESGNATASGMIDTDGQHGNETQISERLNTPSGNATQTVMNSTAGHETGTQTNSFMPDGNATDKTFNYTEGNATAGQPGGQTSFFMPEGNDTDNTVNDTEGNIKSGVGRRLSAIEDSLTPQAGSGAQPWKHMPWQARTKWQQHTPKATQFNFSSCIQTTVTGISEVEAWGLEWPGLFHPAPHVEDDGEPVDDEDFEEYYVRGKLAGMFRRLLGRLAL